MVLRMYQIWKISRLFVGLNGEKRHKFSFRETPHKFIIAKLWILKLRFFSYDGGGEVVHSVFLYTCVHIEGGGVQKAYSSV